MAPLAPAPAPAPAPAQPPKKKQRRHYADASWRCSDCTRSDTPVRRLGPAGPRSLCNACGLRRSKLKRLAAAAAAAPGIFPATPGIFPAAPPDAARRAARAPLRQRRRRAAPPSHAAAAAPAPAADLPSSADLLRACAAAAAPTAATLQPGAAADLLDDFFGGAGAPVTPEPDAAGARAVCGEELALRLQALPQAVETPLALCGYAGGAAPTSPATPVLPPVLPLDVLDEALDLSLGGAGQGGGEVTMSDAGSYTSFDVVAPSLLAPPDAAAGTVPALLSAMGSLEDALFLAYAG